MSRSVAAPASAPRRALLPRRPRRLWLPGLGGLPRPLTAVARLVSTGLSFVWRRRRLRIAALSALVAVPLLGGGWLWFRHSSFVAVERVEVDGVVANSPQAGAIEAALEGAARGMSTLAVKPAALNAAVERFPVVRSVRAHARFPHGLRIEVLEQPPVAGLTIGGVRTAVAADGVVLGPAFLSGSLPAVNVGKAAAATVAGRAGAPPAVGKTVRGTTLLQMLAVLGAAPAPLARDVTRAYSGPQGVTVAFKSGLLAYFGDATRPHAKWSALARVLADASSAGAAYIDVRLPERPAAGFAPGATLPGTGTAATEPGSASDPNTAAELAAGLDAAVGGGLSTGSSGGSGGGSEQAASAAAAPPEGGAETQRTPAGETHASAGETQAPAGETQAPAVTVAETPEH